MPRVWWAFAFSFAFFIRAGYCSTEPAFRRFGLILQVIGIATVVMGIWTTRKDFGKRFGEDTRQWLSKRPAWNPAPNRAKVSATLPRPKVTCGLAHASPVVLEADMVKRIEALEQNLDALDQRCTQMGQATKTELLKQAGALREEERCRAEVDQQLRSLLADTATGGLDLSAAGVVLLLFGVVMSTIPQEWSGPGISCGAKARAETATPADHQVQNDHLERLAQVRKPILAVAELVWNAVDADADQVDVAIHEDALGGFEAIEVSDNGHGMPLGEAEGLFSRLGGSWKRGGKRSREKARLLHGQEWLGRIIGHGGCGSA